MRILLLREVLRRGIDLLRLLFSKPAPQNTQEAKSSERYRRAAWTTVVVTGSRFLNILTGLVSVPITLKYLGDELFGVWMVLTSIVGFLSFYDFGIGVGLRNLLIECAAHNDTKNARIFIGNALFALCALAAFMIGLVLLVAPWVPWSTLIKCSGEAAMQLQPAAQAVLIIFALGLPINQLLNISSAYQRGYWGYLCLLTGRLLGFLFILLCVFFDWPFWVLAAGFLGFPYLVMLFGWGFFLVRIRELRPWPVPLRISTMKRLFGIGFYVLIHHLSFALINTSATILIANTISATATVPYSVSQKLLSTVTIFSSSLLVGLSVAVGDAWHSGDLKWTRKTLRQSEWLIVLTTFAPLFVLTVAGQLIIGWWTGSQDAIPSFFLLAACALSTAAATWGSIFSNCLMAMNFVRFIALTKLSIGVLVFAGGYFLGKYTQSPTAIAFLQGIIGLTIPALLFQWKFNLLMKEEKR